VAALGVYLFAAGGEEAPPQIVGLIDSSPPDVGQPAPDFALTDVRDADRVIKLSDFRGKVVVLNWYASWCGPCRTEIPDFQVAYDQLEGDVVVFGVNLQETRGEAAGLLDDLGASYPAVLDEDGEVSQHYRVSGLPVTYIIDRDGIIMAGGQGIVTDKALREQLSQFGLDYPES
jgi:peroxiredoxin